MDELAAAAAAGAAFAAGAAAAAAVARRPVVGERRGTREGGQCVALQERLRSLSLKRASGRARCRASRIA